MLMQKKDALLILRSVDLPLDINNVNGTSNKYGSTNQFRTRMTWNNINLRTLLGDMYDKYDAFNLKLVQISSVPSSSIVNNILTPTLFGNFSLDRQLYVYLSGLPFINQTYNSKNGCNTNKALLYAITNANTLINQYNFDQTNYLTFSKKDSFDLTIELLRQDDTLPLTPIEFPNITFIFCIHGVVNDKDNSTNKRMF